MTLGMGLVHIAISVVPEPDGAAHMHACRKALWVAPTRVRKIRGTTVQRACAGGADRKANISYCTQQMDGTNPRYLIPGLLLTGTG